MANHRARRYAPSAPQRGKSCLDRKDGDLGPFFVRPPCGIWILDQLDDGPARLVHGQRVAGLHDSAENRLFAQQRAPHAYPLRAVSGINEYGRHRFVVCGGPVFLAISLEEQVELRGKRRGRGAYDGGSVRVMGPAYRGAETDIAELLRRGIREQQITEALREIS